MADELQALTKFCYEIKLDISVLAESQRSIREVMELHHTSLYKYIMCVEKKVEKITEAMHAIEEQKLTSKGVKQTIQQILKYWQLIAVISITIFINSDWAKGILF